MTLWVEFEIRNRLLSKLSRLTSKAYRSAQGFRMNLYSNPELFTNQHLEHQRHLPVLQQLQKQISKALSSVDLDKCGDLKFVSKVCCLTISRVIDDLNRAILQSLEIGSYSAAESLSRTSL